MFGQLLIGPPGSGKSTLCTALSAFMRANERDVCVVNLDPANDALPYTCDIDIADLVSLDVVQDELGLGPNGALMYCIEFLQENLDWLKDSLEPHMSAGRHIMFDCPGQAELYMCHDAFRSIMKVMTTEWHLSLTIVQLVDAHLCVAPNKCLAALLMCLTSMLHLELPHVNVLSKVDMLEQLEEGHVDVEDLTNVRYLQQQLELEESSFSGRFAPLTEGLCDVLDNYSLLNLTPVAVEQRKTLAQLLDYIDRANGFAYSGLQRNLPDR